MRRRRLVVFQESNRFRVCRKKNILKATLSKRKEMRLMQANWLWTIFSQHELFRGKNQKNVQCIGIDRSFERYPNNDDRDDHDGDTDTLTMRTRCVWMHSWLQSSNVTTCKCGTFQKGSGNLFRNLKKWFDRIFGFTNVFTLIKLLKSRS